jgi:hypothetical protein
MMNANEARAKSLKQWEKRTRDYIEKNILDVSEGGGFKLVMNNYENTFKGHPILKELRDKGYSVSLKNGYVYISWK